MPPRILLLAAFVAGCGGAASPPAIPRPDRPADACLLRGAREADAGRGATPPVAAASGADTGLVSPARARTPIGLDCDGTPVPRLASAWSSSSAGHNWTLVVPSAADLANAWRNHPAAAAALRLAGVGSYTAVDDHRLVVSFAAAHGTVPALFADPALADTVPGDPTAFRLLPPSPDLRDAVDRGADLVITADPAVAEYAARLGGYSARPLPWSRTYLLLAPGGVASLGVDDTAAFREELARDAVSTWARGAQGPQWWDGAGCTPRAAAPVAPTMTVVYPSSDPIARGLAERIVATARSAGRASGVADEQLGAAIARGLGTAYVLSLPLVPLVPCREIAAWPDGARAVPLVDTRRTALVRAGAPAYRVDHDGGIVPASVP